ncbi:hypothetical protein [Roseimaritima multifibrata]|nr:hypothetical protein [Roseimaritima multifibrata]
MVADLHHVRKMVLRSGVKRSYFPPLANYLKPQRAQSMREGE